IFLIAAGRRVSTTAVTCTSSPINSPKNIRVAERVSANQLPIGMICHQSVGEREIGTDRYFL
ncbi:MAG: hypothetical protein WAU27_01415, partial [Pseudomonadales bacterium]